MYLEQNELDKDKNAAADLITTLMDDMVGPWLWNAKW